jgi:hypothetical protein
MVKRQRKLSNRKAEDINLFAGLNREYIRLAT